MMEKVRPFLKPREGADSIEALWRAEFVPMVRLAYNLIGSVAEAEEVVQDSFADVYRRREEIRAPGAYLRATVVLKYYGRYRASEIAKIMDMPGATVRSHLKRGLAKLRKELEP